MGTNFYVEPRVSSKDMRVLKKYGYDVPCLHLGKSSSGWKFLFQGFYDKPFLGEEIDISSVSDWKQFVIKNELRIVDGYGKVYTWEQFIKFVDNRQEELSGEENEKTNPLYQIIGKTIFNKDGYEFCFSDFS